MKALVLKHKEKKNVTYLLILFNNHGVMNYSIGQRYDYTVESNLEIDYWENAEYYRYDDLDLVLSIFNKL